FAKSAARRDQQGDQPDDRRDGSGFLALTAGALQHRGQRIAAALAHEARELAHDRGLRRLSPEYEPGDRDDDQQQRGERKYREIRDRRRMAHRLMARKAGNRVFDQIPDFAEHLVPPLSLGFLQAETRPAQCFSASATRSCRASMPCPRYCSRALRAAWRRTSPAPSMPPIRAAARASPRSAPSPRAERRRSP